MNRASSYFSLGLTSLGGWGLVAFGCWRVVEGAEIADAMHIIGSGIGIVGIGGKIERGS